MAHHNYHSRYAEYKKMWSLKRYCSYGFEQIENYQQAAADGFKGWCIHHRLEFTVDGNLAHTSDSLKRLGMYYHRPYFLAEMKWTEIVLNYTIKLVLKSTQKRPL